MPKGGARPGAGRKAGSPNKANAEREAEVKASGITPLDYMLTMLRNETETPANRMWAAEKAAPFVHPKLAAVEHSGGMTFTHEDALDELDDKGT
jgi:hypothetical protein